MAKVKGVEKYVKNDIIHCTNIITYFILEGMISLIHNTKDGKAIALALYGVDEMLLPCSDDCEFKVVTPTAQLIKVQFLDGFTFTKGEKYLYDKLMETQFLLKTLCNATYSGSNTEDRKAHTHQRLQMVEDLIKEKSGGKEYPISQTCIAELAGLHRETVSRVRKRLRSKEVV